MPSADTQFKSSRVQTPSVLFSLRFEPDIWDIFSDVVYENRAEYVRQALIDKLRKDNPEISFPEWVDKWYNR